MNVPVELKYTKDHEWVKLEGDLATVGITDFAQGELGDVVYVEVETLGETLEAEEVFGTIEAVKTVSDLFMPISGEIVELNEAIEDEPEVVNDEIKNPLSKMILFGELTEGGRVEVTLTADNKLAVDFKAKKVVTDFKPKLADEKTSQ